jgi:hypothetical protein
MAKIIERRQYGVAEEAKNIENINVAQRHRRKYHKNQLAKIMANNAAKRQNIEKAKMAGNQQYIMAISMASIMA